MRKTYIYWLLMGLLVGSLFPLHAQDQLLPYPTDTVDGKIYYLYTVERSIGLYRVSLNFGVTQEEILKANPHLQQQGLRFEEVIRIPAKIEVKTETKIEEKTTKIEEKIDSRIENKAERRKAKNEDLKEKKRARLVLFDDDNTIKRKPTTIHTAATDTIVTTDTIQADSLSTTTEDYKAIRLAYMLPLHTDAIKREKNMERFYDFYVGALIAVYEAQARGQRIEVYTYDIGKTAQRTKEVIANNLEIRQADAIIGPAYSQQVKTLIDSIQQDSIWCLIPFLSKVEGMDQHNFLMKFNPSEQIEADTLARYLAQRKDSVNCVLVEQKEGEVIPSGITALHKALQQHGVPTSSITLKALLTDSITDEFDAVKENIIIFNTERYTNLQTVMPHLLNACGNYRITLFSHYSWQNENIILPQIYTSVFAPTPVVPDTYEQLYDQYFAHELCSTQPRYDLLGYDLTTQLLRMLMQYNDTTHQPNDVFEGVQANIQYIQTQPQGGYENHIINIIHQ